jgi:hypothetical protein
VESDSDFILFNSPGVPLKFKENPNPLLGVFLSVSPEMAALPVWLQWEGEEAPDFSFLPLVSLVPPDPSRSWVQDTAALMVLAVQLSVPAPSKEGWHKEDSIYTLLLPFGQGLLGPLY